jgi:hypothetical protein
MFKQKDKNIVITFGKPVSFQTFDKRHTPDEWARLLKEFVYDLGAGRQTEFEG